MNQPLRQTTPRWKKGVVFLTIAITIGMLFPHAATFAESAQVSADSSNSLISGQADKTAADAKAKADQTKAAADVQAAADAAAAAKTAAANLQASNNAANGITGADGGDGCSLYQITTWFTCLARGMAGFILDICTFILGIAGSLLNWVILRAVFQFSLLIGNSPGLLTAWSVLRDIGNLLLLFGFIFIGLATILDLHTYAAKRTLPQLIIFAILMNFSLFAAEAVIDVSNGLTSVIYNQTNGATCAGDINGGVQGQPVTTAVAGAAGNGAANAAGRGFDDCAKDYGLASVLMQSMGINSIFGIAPGESLKVSAVALIGMSILSLIAAGVFLAAAIMLLVRAVVLTFLMVFAPLGFAGMAIPPLRGVAMDWWHRLINQAFFAPVLFLLIFVSVNITNGLADTATRGSLANALTQGNSGTMGVIMVFAIVIAFLLASLVAAKKMGAASAGFATNFGMKIAFGGFSRAANLGVGGSAFLARKGLRRLDIKNPTSGVGRTWNSANQLLRSRVLQRAQSANFDLRRLPGVGGALGAAGATAAAKADEHADFDSLRHTWQNRGERGRELDKSEEFDAKKQRLAKEAHAGNLSAESQQFLGTLSAEQIAADHDLQHALESAAGQFSTSQFDAIMKNDKVSQTTKDKFARDRYDPLQNVIDTNDKEKARNITNKELELIGKYRPELLAGLASKEDSAAQDGTGESLLSVEQSDHLGKSENVSANQRTFVKNNTMVGRVNGFVQSGNYAKAVPMAGKMVSKQKAKLFVSTLSDSNIIDTYTASDLAEIQREQKLNPDQIRALMATLRASANPNLPEIEEWIRNKPDARMYWNR